MLTIYRRHSEDCPYKAKGRAWIRCTCPLHADGTLNGREHRQSLGTRSREKAIEIVRELEAKGFVAPVNAGFTVQEAVDSFFREMASGQGLAPGTRKAHATFHNHLLAFCEGKGIVRISQFGLADMEALRQSWDGLAFGTKRRMTDHASCLFKYLIRHGQCQKNWARELSKLYERDLSEPSMPYSQEEIARILEACSVISIRGKPHVAAQLKALCLLMRYSGLRRLDALLTPVESLSGQRLYLYTTQKTRVPIFALLPPMVAETLSATPRVSAGYFFWNGVENKNALIVRWQDRMEKLGNIAKVDDFRFHRFRDTFAIELLNAGKSLEQVQMALGHKSIVVTQRHYGHWLTDRQASWERELGELYAKDPVLKQLDRPQKLRRVK